MIWARYILLVVLFFKGTGMFCIDDERAPRRRAYSLPVASELQDRSMQFNRPVPPSWCDATIINPVRRIWNSVVNDRMHLFDRLSDTYLDTRCLLSGGHWVSSILEGFIHGKGDDLSPTIRCTLSWASYCFRMLDDRDLFLEFKNDPKTNLFQVIAICLLHYSFAIDSAPLQRALSKIVEGMVKTDRPYFETGECIEGLTQATIFAIPSIMYACELLNAQYKDIRVFNTSVYHDVGFAYGELGFEGLKREDIVALSKIFIPVVLLKYLWEIPISTMFEYVWQNMLRYCIKRIIYTHLSPHFGRIIGGNLFHEFACIKVSLKLFIGQVERQFKRKSYEDLEV